MAGRINDVVMTVIFFNVRPGFGKLKNDQFKEVFIHTSYIEDCGGQYNSNGDKLLVPNQQVRCDLIPNPKKPNGMMAINVKVCPPETQQQLIERDLRGDVQYFDPARQSGVISSRLYGPVDFKAEDFNGPAHRLTEKPIVAFDLARRQATKMAVNIRALGEGANADVSVIERGILGEVAQLHKTFGFIKTGSRRAFFHLSEIKGGETVRVGQIVRFDLTPGSKGPGSFAAINISIVSGAVDRPAPKAPGSRAGSMASRSRKNVPRQNAQPLKVNPERPGERPSKDVEEPVLDIRLDNPQRRIGERPFEDLERLGPDVRLDNPQRRIGERPFGDLERLGPDVRLDNPQRRIGEKPSRDLERPEFQNRAQQKQREESNERVNRLLEEQRKTVARHSAAMSERPKQPNRPESLERPYRDIEREEGPPAPAYVPPSQRRNDTPPSIGPTTPFFHDSRRRSQALRTTGAISNPLSAPVDPPARHDPQRSSPLQPVNPRALELFQPPLGAARFDLLPSYDLHKTRPVPQRRTPVLSGFRQTGGVKSSDSDSNDDSDDSDENDVPFERLRRRSPSPPPRQRSLKLSYEYQGDPTRPNETRECRICQKVVNWPLKTPCEHLFCRACIEKWLKFQPTCPLSSCQKDLQVDQLQPGL